MVQCSTETASDGRDIELWVDREKETEETSREMHLWKLMRFKIIKPVLRASRGSVPVVLICRASKAGAGVGCSFPFVGGQH